MVNFQIMPPHPINELTPCPCVGAPAHAFGLAKSTQERSVSVHTSIVMFPRGMACLEAVMVLESPTDQGQSWLPCRGVLPYIAQACSE